MCVILALCCARARSQFVFSLELPAEIPRTLMRFLSHDGGLDRYPNVKLAHTDGNVSFVIRKRDSVISRFDLSLVSASELHSLFRVSVPYYKPPKSLCKIWATGGSCAANTQFMRVRCPFSCTKRADTFTSDYCLAMALSGKCQASLRHMQIACFETCAKVEL